jgi:S1-C subfamily serine protease
MCGGPSAVVIAPSSVSEKRVFVIALVCGVFGGGLVVAAAVSTGALDSSPKIISRIREVSVIPDNGSRRSRGFTEHEIYERDAPGVVLVTAARGGEAQSPAEFLKGESDQHGAATGSGFEVDGRGTILTNAHVIARAGRITVSLDGINRPVVAKVVARDAALDLGVLRIPIGGLTLHPLSLGDSDTVQVGELATAIGNPFGYTRTLTTGVISAVQRNIRAPDGTKINNVLQTDAPINPGNSGGPLIDEQGQVIGINSQIVTAGGARGNIGIAFAIPINMAKNEFAAFTTGKSGAQ